MTNSIKLSRRSFLRGGSGAAALALVGAGTTATVFNAFMSRKAHAASPDYGPLSPTPDEATGIALLSLPAGFRYVSFGWTGDVMTDGIATPGLHDGMAVCKTAGNNLTLVRNHEQGSAAPSFGRPAITFDPNANGGTTNITFNTKQERWTKSEASISGTVRNCAGGVTPWQSWLTCEETSVSVGSGFTQDHGWVFEVPSNGNGRPTPLKKMGRFEHEALAVDPATTFIYETEDRTPGGFYKYVPSKRILRSGQLEKNPGELFMLKIKNAFAAQLYGRGSSAGGFAPGETYDVEWVPIADPERLSGVAVADQGIADGATAFSRPEGIWYDAGRFYWTCTNGGPASQGQIWEYTPLTEQLRLIYVAPAQQPGVISLNNPDNIAVQRNRGIVLCEDGGRSPQHLHVMNFAGDIAPFAANNINFATQVRSIPAGDYSGSEWCGACFSDDGKWLFVNIQNPGITFAITGPWKDETPAA